MKVQMLTALLPALLAGTLLANTATGEFLLDKVPTETNPIALQTTDKIAYSVYWQNGDSATVTAHSELKDQYSIHETSAGDLQGQCCWNYTNSVPMPEGGNYVLTHATTKAGTSVGTLSCNVTIAPEPALALVLGLLGIFLARRKNALKALAAAAILLPALGAKADTVSNVKAMQRWPWNGHVDVEYTLEKDATTATETPFFSVEFKFEGQTSKTVYPIIQTNFFGEGSSGQTIGAGTKKVTYKFMGGANTEKEMVTVSVTAHDITSQQKYLKVDLVNKTLAKDISIPDKWTDDDKTKCMWFKWIPAGKFTMGSPSDELGRSSNEAEHEVTLTKGYWIGVFEMTQGQYDYITEASKKSDSAVTKSNISYDDLRGYIIGGGWPSSTKVDASSVIGKLRALVTAPESFRFDLPTEAQWECACRSGNGAYKWGNGTAIESDTKVDGNLDKLGWYRNNRPEKACQPVGQLLPNDWGLYDMHGNACEWCLDRYQEDISSFTSDPVGPDNGKDRVYRGGAHIEPAKNCRSAQRNKTDSSSAYSSDAARIAISQ